MKLKTLTGVLGILLAAVFVLASPAFAYHPHNEGGYFGYGYENNWDIDRDYSYGDDRDYSYGDYEDYGYGRSPYYGSGRYYDYDNYYGSEHPSGLFGYWGKDADHHRRGHRHHHWF